MSLIKNQLPRNDRYLLLIALLDFRKIYIGRSLCKMNLRYEEIDSNNLDLAVKIQNAIFPLEDGRQKLSRRDH